MLSNTFNNKRFQGQGINDPWPYLREILVHRKARWLNTVMGNSGNTLNHFHVLLFHGCSRSIRHDTIFLLDHLPRLFHHYLKSANNYMGQSLCWGKKIDQIVNFRDILDFDEAFKLLKWYWSSCRILFFSTYKTLFHNIWDILMFLCLLPIWGWAPNALRNVFVKEKLLLYF